MAPKVIFQNTINPTNLVILLILGLAASTTKAEPSTLQLTSLEWPPYSGSTLPEQGASSAVVRDAFAAAGYTLRIQFVPWSRAVRMAQTNPNVAGYFPEYRSPKVEATCVLSDSLGRSPLGLAERREQPLQWQHLPDLASYTLGVIQDYVNTEELDQRIRSGQQRVDQSVDDASNLLKLANRRIDAAVIDPYVFLHLITTDKRVQMVREKLALNSRMLETKTLHVCFKDNAEGRRLAKVFNEGLRHINSEAIMRRLVAGYR